MITHTSDSLQIPSQSNTKSKLNILKNCKTFTFWNFARTFARDTPSEVELLDKMYKDGMDPTRTVGATEQTRDAGRTDGQMDGRTDGQAGGRSEIN